MTDKLWGMHRIMAEKIMGAYLDLNNAAELDKPNLEKRLLYEIIKRGQYSHKPSA